MSTQTRLRFTGSPKDIADVLRDRIKDPDGFQYDESDKPIFDKNKLVEAAAIFRALRGLHDRMNFKKKRRAETSI